MHTISISTSHHHHHRRTDGRTDGQTGPDVFELHICVFAFCFWACICNNALAMHFSTVSYLLCVHYINEARTTTVVVTQLAKRQFGDCTGCAVSLSVLSRRCGYRRCRCGCRCPFADYPYLGEDGRQARRAAHKIPHPEHSRHPWLYMFCIYHITCITHLAHEWIHVR